MSKKVALLSAILLVSGLGLATVAQAVGTAGSNVVSVQSCEQVGRDIRVKTASTGPTYLLTSTCRNAGHGLRNYTLACTSAKQYRVSWTDCSVPTPQPTDTQRPTVSASVTYSSVWYPGNSAQKVVPTLAARATDTNKVTKVVLYYNTTQLGEGYSVLKTCTANTAIASCSYTFTNPTHGNFYAVAWDNAGNTATSTKFSF